MPSDKQRFWRSADLPFIEAREVSDGREVCYDRHSHETFSIGAITGGVSTYVNGGLSEQVEAGCVVIMNPGEVHACNPLRDEPWSYRMLYIDADWLGGVQHDCAPAGVPGFQPYAAALSRDPALFVGLNGLYDVLVDDAADLLQKESAAISFFVEAQQILGTGARPVASENPRLVRAAEFINAHCTQSLRLEEICHAASLSPSYLIRAFKARYAMTPHEYLINCRIQFGRAQLKRGVSIVSAAAEAGFADQAHFNRAFKRLVAATPGQYRRVARS